MKLDNRIAAALGAVALTASGIALTSGTASAQATGACDHVSASNKSNGIVQVVAASGYTAAYDEPGSTCNRVASMAPGKDLNAWCYVTNTAGNQWTRVTQGWIYNGHIALKSGSVKRC